MQRQLLLNGLEAELTLLQVRRFVTGDIPVEEVVTAVQG